MASEASFLGRGWAFPPTFVAGGSEVEMVDGVEDIHQSLTILLSTERGERVMNERYGCELSSVLFEEVDQGLINEITQLISDAILDGEPRVRLEGVEVADGESQAGKLLIKIDYTVRSSNSRFNMVFPFYLREARVPASGSPGD